MLMEMHDESRCVRISCPQSRPYPPPNDPYFAPPHCVRSVPGKSTADNLSVWAGTAQHASRWTVEVIRAHFRRAVQGLRLRTVCFLMTRFMWRLGHSGCKHHLESAAHDTSYCPRSTVVNVAPGFPTRADRSAGPSTPAHEDSSGRLTVAS